MDDASDEDMEKMLKALKGDRTTVTIRRESMESYDPNDPARELIAEKIGSSANV